MAVHGKQHVRLHGQGKHGDALCYGRHQEGKPCDARRYSNKAFPTLLRDGLVTERGEPSEGFKQEFKAYEKERQARKARQRAFKTLGPLVAP